MYKTIALVFLFLGTLSCTKLNTINDIEIDVSTSTSVPGQTGLFALLSSFGFDSFTKFDISSSQTFQDEIGDVSRVEYANLETFTLSIGEEGESLDFFDSVSFYISIDGESEAILAWSTDFPMDSKSVSLSVDKTLDLTPYIKSKNIKIRAEVSGNQPSEDTEVIADLLFLIDAKIIK